MTANVTLDTNCLYELEKSQPAAALRNLAALGRRGAIRLQIPAIAAAENQPGGRALEDFGHFQKRVTSAGLEFAELLLPPCYIGMVYIDWFIIGGDEDEREERQIHNILFPNVPFRALATNDVQEKRKWLNAKCDVLALWCHIHHDGEIFVTWDNNFHKASKKPRLEALGAGTIATPDKALLLLQPTAGPHP